MSGHTGSGGGQRSIDSHARSPSRNSYCIRKSLSQTEEFEDAKDKLLSAEGTTTTRGEEEDEEEMRRKQRRKEKKKLRRKMKAAQQQQQQQ